MASPDRQLTLVRPDDAASLPGAMDAARAHLRDEAEEAKRSAGPSPRRLLVAGILILFGGILFFVVLPYLGVYLHPIIPLGAFAAILVGAILSGTAERDLLAEEDEELTAQPPREDEGRPVLCCPGPRPVGSLRLPPSR